MIFPAIKKKILNFLFDLKTFLKFYFIIKLFSVYTLFHLYPNNLINHNYSP